MKTLSEEEFKKWLIDLDLAQMQSKPNVYCSPLDIPYQRWIIIFDDKDKNSIVLTNKEQAYNDFAALESAGWNCHLFETSKRITKNDE